MKLIICFISITLDLLFINIFKFSSFNISYFFPMLTITSLVFISNFYKHKNRKNYYFFTLLISIIYDAFFINNLLISIFLFETIAFLNIKIKDRFDNNLFFNILRLIFSIFMYDFLFYLLLVVIKFQNFDFNRLIYKVSHSFIINILYIILMFLVLKPQKYNNN